jgi:hypothetical protein
VSECSTKTYLSNKSALYPFLCNFCPRILYNGKVVRIVENACGGVKIENAFFGNGAL